VIEQKTPSGNNVPQRKGYYFSLIGMAEEESCCHQQKEVETLLLSLCSKQKLLSLLIGAVEAEGYYHQQREMSLQQTKD